MRAEEEAAKSLAEANSTSSVGCLESIACRNLHGLKLFKVHHSLQYKFSPV